MGESGCVHLPSSLSGRPHNLQGDGSRLSQDDSDCSRVVQHALVLGPAHFDRFRSFRSVQAPSTKDLVTRPFDGFLHQYLRNLNLHAWLLEPLPFRMKGSLKKWHQELKLLTDSTRAVYISKWADFVQWCKSDELDFRSPSMTLIADFLLHLFRDRKL